MSIEDVIKKYKELDRNEVERRLAEAECTLSRIGSERWQTDENYDQDGFQELHQIAQTYFTWVWERK